MEKEKIVLIGGGGHCHSVIDVLEQQNRYEIIGIIDKKELLGESVLGYKIIGTDNDLEDIFQICKNAIITVGQIKTNEIRVKLFEKLKTIGFNFPTIISPLAYVSKHSCVSEGTIIMHHALINSNVTIGKNCIVNSKALIEHDSIIGDNCHISTASVVNGGVIIKNGTFYGSNATSKENVSLEGFIKAGSLVK
jgi:sugar O-acyltransferase (sialic acid O-acetyltransferase NeuD family)